MDGYEIIDARCRSFVLPHARLETTRLETPRLETPRLETPRLETPRLETQGDGFRCDQEGNLWSSAGDGVHCIDPGGNLLGKVKAPATVSNLAFGGRNRSRLFLSAGQTLYAIHINKRGAVSP